MASFVSMVQAATDIVGGQPSSQWPGVGVVVVTTTGGDGFCTGTAITPQWVLTAAHCVDPDSVGPSPSFSFLVGSDIASPDIATYAVDQAIFDASFNINDVLNGHDIAVLHIKDVSLPVLPFKLNSQSLSNAFVGKHVVITGYGDTSGSGTGGGIKRSATITISQVDGILLQGGGTPSTCSGDSGGPAFVYDTDGFPVIMGIASFGDAQCDVFQGFDRVDVLLPFISANVTAGTCLTGASCEGIFRNGMEPPL